MSTPIGPYSPIVEAGPWLICSGQLGIGQPAPSRSESGIVVRASPVLVEGGAAAQLTQALSNAEALLRSSGATPADVVKTTVFLVDIGDAPSVNEAYAEFFAGHRPSRSMVAVAALPMGASVEVELWAYRDRS